MLNGYVFLLNINKRKTTYLYLQIKNNHSEAILNN